VGPGGGNVWKIYFNPKRAKVGWVWVKPTAAIAQIVSGMRALVWTELATDRSKHARLTLAETSRLRTSDREQLGGTILERNRATTLRQSGKFRLDLGIFQDLVICARNTKTLVSY